MNLISAVIKYYVSLLKVRYRIIISYYPRINRKIENLNEILKRILIKYLIKKLTRFKINIFYKLSLRRAYDYIRL
jgi:hypothetical protein